MRQSATESGQRRAAMSVAEALRSRFPSDTQTRRRPTRLSVAEALHSRFPQPRTPAGDDPLFAGAGGPVGPMLPRRIRRSISVPGGRAQPASPELLRRILDGLLKL
jgi:hypothetical protein